MEGIPDELFHPGQESMLVRRIEEIVDRKIKLDKIPVGHQLKCRFLESLMADITNASRERFGTS